MHHDPEVTDESEEFEGFEGPASGSPASAGRAIAGPRLGLSVPGAIGGVLLVGAIAFGANLGLVGSSGPLDGDAKPTFVAYEAPEEEPTAKPTAEEPSGKKSEPTDKAEPTDKIEPTAEPTAKPTAEPTAKPTAEPTEKPDATPKPTEKPVMSLSLAIKEGAVSIDWSGCTTDGGDYYKVVRSGDKTVSWPTGSGDEVVAVTEVGGATKAWDEHAPAGEVAWYRVFCVRGTEDGYKALAATATKAIEVPGEPEPTKTPAPTPYAMWIEAGSEAGVVTIHWEGCGSDGFSHYRILRKVDGSASLRAEIEDAGTTTFVDDDVEVGMTYHYLVQAKGMVSGAWVLLGTTSWTGITVE